MPCPPQLPVWSTCPHSSVLVGAVLTAIIQSSSASVGILQALSATGQVSYSAAIPIIMGQNIGTCVTALLSSVGTNKNARRAAVVHLMFNILGTAFCLVIFCLVDALLHPALLDMPAGYLGIAVAHTSFNLICTLLLLPQAGLLEKLACKIVPDDKKPVVVEELDERLLSTPPVALERCRMLCTDMALAAQAAIDKAVKCLKNYQSSLGEEVRAQEEKTDHYEDILGSYLVKFSTQAVNASDSAEAAGLLKSIGDFERIADYAVNLVESAEELHAKEIALTPRAEQELSLLCEAVEEAVDLAVRAFSQQDIDTAATIEPLEEVIDRLHDALRSAHIRRLQKGLCSIEAGFVWADLLTSLERVSDHCSNVGACVIDTAHNTMNLHESVRSVRSGDADFEQNYEMYREKYMLAPEK